MATPFGATATLSYNALFVQQSVKKGKLSLLNDHTGGGHLSKKICMLQVDHRDVL
jgi:hypothetical protein